jgi:hypothetical protein
MHRLAFSLRMFSNEDVTIGSWMIAMNVHHEDNREICDPRCTPTSIAVWDIPKCSGNSTLNSYSFFILHISNWANTFSWFPSQPIELLLWRSLDFTINMLFRELVRVFGSMVVVAFQSVFHSEKCANNFFIF